VIERALHSLGGPTIQLVEEAVRRQQLVEEGHYLPQEGIYIYHYIDTIHILIQSQSLFFIILKIDF
jgi:hypothetical protein